MEQEFTKLYLQESHRIIDELSVLDIESVANGLAQARDKGVDGCLYWELVDRQAMLLML